MNTNLCVDIVMPLVYHRCMTVNEVSKRLVDMFPATSLLKASIELE